MPSMFTCNVFSIVIILLLSAFSCDGGVVKHVCCCETGSTVKGWEAGAPTVEETGHGESEKLREELC